MSVEHRIREFLKENFLLGMDSELGSSESLLGSGILDSTGVMELVAFLEKTFEIRVEDRDLIPENLDTLAAVVNFVESKTTGHRTRSIGVL